jgi:hypothetical protein
MKQYSGWQGLFLSFWSPSFYKDVATQWGGVGYSYLFLLVCLTVFFMALQTQIVVVPMAQRIVDSVASQLPSVNIDKGVLSTDKPSPYVIIAPKTSKAVITFDTRPTPMSYEESKSDFLVTSHAIFTRKHGAESPSNDVERVDLAPIDHCVFDTTTAKQTANSFLQWLGTLMFMLTVPFGFALCVFQTLIYALVGMIYCAIFSVKLGYPTLIRLSSVSLTPVLLIDSLQKVATVNFQAWWWISILLALGYLCFAVWANKEETPATPQATTTGPS